MSDECEHGSLRRSCLVCELIDDHAAALAAKDAEIAELRAGFNEYSECLQDLCMRRLYEICRPVSHGWPGQKHVTTIRQAAEHLIARAERAEAEAAGLRADAERWRAVSAMMTHEHRADAVGWTLGALLPGDDPDAAADAVIAARAGGEHAS